MSSIPTERVIGRNSILHFGAVFLALILVSPLVFAEDAAEATPTDPKVVTELQGIQKILAQMGPILSIILIILGGFIYGFAQLQPADNRGRFTQIALGFVIGGIVIAAITMGASAIEKFGENILK